MPVYTINTPQSSRNSWAAGLKSLADAFAPDPRYALGMAEMGLARDKFDFERGLETERLELDRTQTAAQINQLEAAAELARLNGDVAAEKAITETKLQLVYESEARENAAQAAGYEGENAASSRFTTLMGDPEASVADTIAAAAAGKDIDIEPAVIGATHGMGMGDKLDTLVYAAGNPYGDTQMGTREKFASDLAVKQAEPITVTQDSNVFLAPDDPRRLSPENPLLPGQTSVDRGEQVIPVNVPGAPERPTVTGPNYVADPDALPEFKNYAWTQDGKQFSTLARVMPDGSIRDREGAELPFNAIVIGAPQVNATGMGKLDLTESGAKVADLVPQVIMGVQDMNDLVGYDATTDEFKDGGVFPGMSSVVGNTVESLVGAIAGKELGTYAGLVTRKDFDNEYDYQMFRITEPLLRFRSGAATPEEEVARYRMYAPRAGESRELAQRKIRDLNRLASAMAFVAQKRGIPVMEVVSATAILPGAGIMDPEMRAEVESALAEAKKPNATPPPVPAAPGAVVPEFRF